MSCFSAKTSTATTAEPDPSKHVNYNLGMVLGVDDFQQEFAYLSGRDQWMARDLIGYGTVRGLRVGIEVDADKGPRVVVEPGAAVSPRGQMICVPAAQCAYLRDCLDARAEEFLAHLGSPLPGSLQMYVVLCYRDCPTDDVPIAGEPCRSEAELMAPSRTMDDFCLQLRPRKPKQREEEAVRDFVKWLKQIEITDPLTSSTPLEQFLDAIRTAAGEWLASPPGSPPGDFLFGSPPAWLHISAADTCEYMRAAFRLWVTELRPKWIARWHGCAATHFDVDDQSEEDCVLLAELTVPIIASSPGHWTVAETPDVVLNQEHRPYVIHLRMLQEWLLCGACCSPAPAGSPPPLGTGGSLELPFNAAELDMVGVPEGLPHYEIVAAGIVKTNGAARGPVFNDLKATLQANGDIALNFKGYRVPTKNFNYIVKVLLVFQAGTERASLTFKSFEKATIGMLMGVSGLSEELLKTQEFMVEVSRYEAQRTVLGPVRPPVPE